MTVLERAARAAEHAYYNDSGPTGEPIDFEAIARAVLMAVRMPSHALAVQADEVVDLTRALPLGEGQAFFTAMIDAILNATPDPGAGG